MTVTIEPPTDIPDGDAEPGTFANMIICEECGTPFEKTGRGRPPKRCADCRAAKAVGGNRTPRSMRVGNDQKQAEAVLDGIYRMVSLGLLMLSPNASQTWESEVGKLRETNAVALAGDPKLCAQIARIGSVSSKGMFYSAHIMAIVPVALVLREDLAIRRAERREAEDNAMPDNVTPMPKPNRNLDFFG